MYDFYNLLTSWIWLTVLLIPDLGIQHDDEFIDRDFKAILWIALDKGVCHIAIKVDVDGGRDGDQSDAVLDNEDNAMPCW